MTLSIRTEIHVTRCGLCGKIARPNDLLEPGRACQCNMNDAVGLDVWAKHTIDVPIGTVHVVGEEVACE